ncbi:TonB-dependent receptor plug domain-containing protein [Opitutus sp. ER46]|uniref:TonB-dependent receptor plug domain-containing protein n=1 Tax=Opitutus sp. ER46 TaxID=2161864 RepID=UPI0011B1CE30|nr:TonB-dependent receptor plug domain-containing protein [Opitutus sp. ER46]
MKRQSTLMAWSRLHATLAASLAVLVASLLPAQTAPAPVDPATLARFDRNGDGVLDPDEAAAMRAAEPSAPPTAPTRAASASSESDNVIQLSPFEVSGSGDRGYFASNTMSGTRLNSKLEDLGASISVVTKQQMQDLALLDVNDIFLYEANTEGTGNYTDYTIDRNGNVIDNVAGNPNNANRIRGITSANQARGNFGLSGRVPIDPINIDALEITRGPNSSIFGLGNASGTVNVLPARANLRRDSSTVELRGDSYGGARASIDLNRVVKRDALAVRASAVFQNDHFQRKPSYAQSERYNGMITWQPYKETTIRGWVEYYENLARRPNAVLPRDGVTYWQQNGRPTWDPSTWTVTRNGVKTVVPYNANQGTETAALGPGLESGGTALYARPSMFVEPDGSIPLWMVGRLSSTDPTTGAPTPDRQQGNQRFVESAPEPRVGPLAQTILSLNDRSLYDWQDVNIAAPNWSRDRVRTFNVELEQFFVRTPRHVLAFQGGWLREEADRYSRQFVGQSSESPMLVYIDVNEKLLDGRANPFFLRPYINATEPTLRRDPFLRDSFKGQLAYQLNLTREKNWVRWLGDHAFSAYGEYKNTQSASYRFRDAVISNHAWLPAGANRANGTTAARGYYRYYLGDRQGDNVDYAPPAWQSSAGTYALNWYNAVTQQWVSEPATIGEAYYAPGAGTQRSRNIIKTTGAVMQNHLLDDRIVTTAGVRRDSNLNRLSTGTPVAPDGITADLVANRTWLEDWLRRDGRTKTYGVVVKPLRNFKWVDARAARGGVGGFLADAARSLTLHYNRSDSFLPEIVAQNLVGELLPDPHGKGKDYGFAISLLGDNRLVLRYNQYESTQEESRAGESGTIASRAARIDFSNTTGGSDRFNLYRNAREWVTQANPTWTNDQVEAEVARQMGFPVGQLARMNAYRISDTSDVVSKGKEIELNYNPTPNLRAKMTVTQQQTIDLNLSPAIQRYIDSRMAVWQSIIDPRSNTPWFTTRYGSGGTASDFLIGSVLAPYKLARANEGKTKSQVRQWRVNALGTLQLAALSDNRYLKRTAVTAAVRWEDKGSIGYYAMADDPNSFDPNRAIFDSGHTYFDFGASYATKLFRNRVSMRVQLNVRNAFEGGRLQPIGALPDGRIHSYRIIDPRLFVLTTSFSL